MNTLKDALNELISNLGIENKINESQAINLWPIMVGKNIAEVSQAERVENKILFVHVTNSVWRNELLFHKEKIIERLNKKIGKRIINDIKFF